MAKIPWGGSVLSQQANDAFINLNSHIPELTKGPRTPTLGEDAMSEQQRRHRMGEDAGQLNPNHVAQIEYAKHPSGRALTAQEWNDKVTADKNKKLQNNGDAASDEQISEVHNLPEKVRKPLVASPADSAIEDKKFTEDLHSRKNDGTFIESSGNSKKKYVHKG